MDVYDRLQVLSSHICNAGIHLVTHPNPMVLKSLVTFDLDSQMVSALLTNKLFRPCHLTNINSNVHPVNFHRCIHRPCNVQACYHNEWIMNGERAVSNPKSDNDSLHLLY